MTAGTGPTPSTPVKPRRSTDPDARQARGMRKRRWVDYAFIVAFVVLLVITATVSDVFFTNAT